MYRKHLKCVLLFLCNELSRMWINRYLNLRSFLCWCVWESLIIHYSIFLHFRMRKSNRWSVLVGLYRYVNVLTWPERVVMVPISVSVFSGADQSKHQSCASLAFVWGIHLGPVNSPHKWPVTRKMLPFDDVIMIYFPRYSSLSQGITNQQC